MKLQLRSLQVQEPEGRPALCAPWSELSERRRAPLASRHAPIPHLPQLFT